MEVVGVIVRLLDTTWVKKNQEKIPKDLPVEANCTFTPPDCVILLMKA